MTFYLIHLVFLYVLMFQVDLSFFITTSLKYISYKQASIQSQETISSEKKSLREIEINQEVQQCNAGDQEFKRISDY